MSKIFESSDNVRNSKPLRHVKTLVFSEPFALELGGILPCVTVAFETYGRLNEARDNAIILCHALSGDSHVAQHDSEDDPGWWDIMVGPGKPIDTNRFFVICPNVLGGCRGTTGPGSINPATEKRYGQNFPTITVGDMVGLQRWLIDRLGIEKLLAVVGGSVGGHQALMWAKLFPDHVGSVVALATSPRLNSQALAFDVVGRNAIRRDPHYYGGQYYDHEHGPEVGLAVARMIGHITYLSPEAMKRKFEADRMTPHEVATEFEKVFSVGSYLGYQGTKFVERFDANSYIALTMAMDLFDMGTTREELVKACPASCRWLIISFSSDWLFPSEQSRDIVNALIARNAPVSYCNVQSSCGHDAFLLLDDFALYGEMIRAFLINQTPPHSGQLSTEAVVDKQSHAPTSIFHQRRLDYDRIVELVEPGASVLDLGCGSGRLLARLKRKGHRRLVGVELDEQKILACICRGLDVVQADLNKGLRAFADQQFDCVVLSQTLQAVLDVEGVIADILRVGRTCIVTFPNIAYHKNRRILAEEGRAPGGSGWMRQKWYNTPDIRFLSIADFEEFCVEKGIRIERRLAMDTEANLEVSENPNYNADLAIFVISRVG